VIVNFVLRWGRSRAAAAGSDLRFPAAEPLSTWMPLPAARMMTHRASRLVSSLPCACRWLALGLTFAHLGVSRGETRRPVDASDQSAAAEGSAYCLELSVTSDIPPGRVAMEPRIDFGKAIREHRGSGMLDPNSIEVANSKTGQPVPFALSDDFYYGDSGRLGWVITSAGETTFEICFRTTSARRPLRPQRVTPPIGVGDLLRYNAEEPRPISLPYPSRLVDLTGDGKPDLAGTWNYAYRPGDPWSGVVCYPATGDPEDFEFGDMLRIRYVDERGSKDFRHFTEIYAMADFADFNGDDLVDLLYAPRNGDQLEFYWNTGERDAAGLPVFVVGGKVPRQTSDWEACRAVDLDDDGLTDVVVGKHWMRQREMKSGLPDFGPLETLEVGDARCFLDVDQDGRHDAIVRQEVDGEGLSNYRLAWQRNQGGAPPRFAAAELLTELNRRCEFPFDVTAAGSQAGLLVSSPPWQNVILFEQIGSAKEFERVGVARSLSAVMALGDQAAPCVCDWEGDGDLDLLVGNGYGYPRIVINEGTVDLPRYAQAQRIMAEGKPIRLTRDEILGSDNWHDMGYPFPAYVDWDDDGLPDLMLPNETNRIYWHKNVGSRQEPAFGPRRQILCEGYPDSAERRAASGALADDRNTPNQPYPHEQGQPFFWRTGAAFDDFNGDGLLDLVTSDGHTRQATLFVQFRDESNELKLRMAGPLKLTDGRPIDQSLVEGSRGWTQSFRATDWNRDGLVDLVYSLAGKPSGGSIQLLLNAGTHEAPVFQPPRPMRAYGELINITNHGPHPWVGDFDGDDLPDLLTYVEASVYCFYSHHTLEMSAPPAFTLQLRSHK
jgi:hypothetical protein